jgi:hypothetical protein
MNILNEIKKITGNASDGMNKYVEKADKTVNDAQHLYEQATKAVDTAKSIPVALANLSDYPLTKIKAYLNTASNANAFLKNKTDSLNLTALTQYANQQPEQIQTTEDKLKKITVVGGIVIVAFIGVEVWIHYKAIHSIVKKSKRKR